MCNFFSCIGFKSGTVECLEFSDSHSEIIGYYGFNGDAMPPQFVRIEFIPPSITDLGETPLPSAQQIWDHISNLDNWKFSVDTTLLPTWWDTTVEAKLKESVKRLISMMFINDKRDYLVGRKCFLGPKADILFMKKCEVKGAVGATIRYAQRCEISHLHDSQVHQVTDQSRIGYVTGKSAIGTMSESHIRYLAKDSVVGTLSLSLIESANGTISKTCAHSFVGDRTLLRVVKLDPPKKKKPVKRKATSKV